MRACMCVSIVCALSHPIDEFTSFHRDAEFSVWPRLLYLAIV